MFVIITVTAAEFIDYPDLNNGTYCVAASEGYTAVIKLSYKEALAEIKKLSKLPGATKQLYTNNYCNGILYHEARYMLKDD